jgi:hypothetical protein
MKECAEIKRKNDEESREIDDIFAARSKLDADTKKVMRADCLCALALALV